VVSTAGAATAAAQLRAAGVTAVLVVDQPGIDPAPLVDWTRRVTALPGLRIDDAWLFRLPRPA
jgi:hypothetical protein